MNEFELELTHEEARFWDECVVAVLRSGAPSHEARDRADWMITYRRERYKAETKDGPY